jgi:hypothetical protein
VTVVILIDQTPLMRRTDRARLVHTGSVTTEVQASPVDGAIAGAPRGCLERTSSEIRLCMMVYSCLFSEMRVGTTPSRQSMYYYLVFGSRFAYSRYVF